MRLFSTLTLLLYLSFPAFGQWTPLSFTTGFDVTDANVYGDRLVVNLGGQMFTSADGGRTVDYISEDAGLGFAVSSYYLDTVLYVVTLDGSIYRTDNWGDTWQTTTVTPGRTEQFTALFAVADFYLATHPTGTIYRSEDGTSWRPIDLGSVDLPANDYLTTGLAIGDTVLAGLEGGVLRSEDRGASWRYVRMGDFDTQVGSLAVGETGILYAGTSGDGVYRSTDSGQSWTELNTGLPDRKRNIIDLLLVSGNELLISTNLAETDSNNLLRLNRATDTWETGFTPITERFVAIELASDGTSLFASTPSDGVFGRPLEQLTGTTSLRTATKAITTLIYPNPAVDQITLPDLPNKAPLIYRIYNTYGHLVQQGSVAQPTPSTTLAIAHLRAGHYTIQFHHTKTYVARFVKQ
ncbi:hypothetical protein LEM8419_02343 [Neolewinella maritima]|uniref:Secretion system C-terminal sorting domain-containing protein n=1 Tax=Neolewinella maritima TaxID=1383882 RepID=A0ABM9B266_9BACT|nr:T9SS type A sorting domain-containing protein [Neolewinella maritima]CAH1001440.1 hypothetical protein LEM8419_02343 [Neolewinella maritima]